MVCAPGRPALASLRACVVLRSVAHHVCVAGVLLAAGGAGGAGRDDWDGVGEGGWFRRRKRGGERLGVGVEWRRRRRRDGGECGEGGKSGKRSGEWEW